MVHSVIRGGVLQQRALPRRLAVLGAAHVIFGFANALLRLSGQGNDPSTAMVLALGGRVGLSLSAMSLIVYGICFAVQCVADRSLVGIGTFINWVSIGLLTDGCYALYNRLFVLPTNLQVVAALVSIVLFSLAASMYQTAALGVSPYDSLSIILSRKSRLPYVGCRIFTDALCVAVCAAFGGVLGIGTLLCAVAVGPIIAFFNRNVSEKLCGIRN